MVNDSDETATKDEETKEGSEDSLETSIQIQYVLYGCSCFFFIVLMCFLYVCKIKVIDSDPSQRHTSARWVRGKQSSFLARC
eukprot:01950.XXX_6883_5867_1 [CDS] Oithona nana genome sequencing.